MNITEIFGEKNGNDKNHEKLGGVPCTKYHSNALIDFITHTGVVDKGNIGTKFISCNKRKTEDIIYKKLDRALSYINWLSNFPKIIVSNLITYTSDQNPILLPSYETLRAISKKIF